ncbi:hypothetical protein SAY87_029693 [Trapa incisa]|uniref:Protein arginine methyltransferase NDUFAF7 n=1 Tax=Trapa incisa TaxID=236973 RepID=A0AAN7Q9L3_9MYRT|nr:hypothetical protein SAY87_029693 [Trapa incisa]
MADLLRGLSKFKNFTESLHVHLVEFSPALQKLQWDNLKCIGRADTADNAENRMISALAGAPLSWHAALKQVPSGLPMSSMMLYQCINSSLRPVMEGPDPDKQGMGNLVRRRTNGSGLGSWVKGQLHSSIAGGRNGCCSKADLRAMPSMIGAMLAPVYLISLDPFPHLEVHSH